MTWPRMCLPILGKGLLEIYQGPFSADSSSFERGEYISKEAISLTTASVGGRSQRTAREHSENNQVKSNMERGEVGSRETAQFLLLDVSRHPLVRRQDERCHRGSRECPRQ